MMNLFKTLGVIGGMVMLFTLVSGPAIRDLAKDGKVYGYDLSAIEVSDYEVVIESTGSDSSSVKSITAECPAGKMVLGGGARIYGSISGTALTTSGPEGPTKWLATAREVVANNNNWGIRVDVFCGTVVDYEVVTALTVSDSSSVKSVTADCPAGKKVLGGGTRIYGSIGGTALTTSGPEGPPSAPTAWFATALEVMPNSNSWGVRVDVFCSTEVYQLYLPLIFRSS